MNANLISASFTGGPPLPEGSLPLPRLPKLKRMFLKMKMEDPRSSRMILLIKSYRLFENLLAIN
jgi:hypothetical protein